MKHLIPQTMAAVSVLALALAVGGCGSSNKATTTTPPGGMNGGDGMTGGDTTLGGLYSAARMASNDATDAAEAAAQAVKDATKYSTMFGTASVNGDSAMAMANAQKVLDARAAANQAVLDAMTALGNAEQAQMDAETHHSGDMNLEDAVDDAFDTATAQHKAAMKSAEHTDLEAAVKMVTGADKDMPMTPADHAKTVAMAIGAALGPTSEDDGAGTRVERESTVPATTLEDVVRMSDNLGMTWAKIVGDVVGMPIADNRASVDVGSIAGMTASDVHPTELSATGGENSGNMYLDGGSTSGANYNGIPGTVYCLGSDCEVDSDDKLAGSWYFAPTSTTDVYTKNDDGAYEQETLYTQFGHWLMVDGSGEATVHVYALTGGTNSSVLGVDDELEGEATYSGTAAGMSLAKSFDSQGVISDGPHSGAFTAEVNLEATFGTAPMVSGTIDNFQSDSGGSNVHSHWSSVELEKMMLTNVATDGVAQGMANGQDSGPAGVWSSQTYGAAGARPTGIFGTFEAHFSDGHASGAYATRED